MSTPTVSEEYVWRWQCDPAWDASGSLVSSPMEVFYRKDLNLGDGSPSTTIASTPGMLRVDLVVDGAKTITTNGKTYTYLELVAAMNAVATQERAIQLTPPVTTTTA